MVHLILGRAGVGKTTFLYEIMKNKLNYSAENITLIVPEQFTFETEKTIAEYFGPSLSNEMNIYGFNRLADHFLTQYGLSNSKAINDDGLLIILSRAVKEVKDQLINYKSVSDNQAFIRSLFSVINEFKQSFSDINSVRDKVNSIKNEYLKQKMLDILLIYNKYNELLGNDYIDTNDKFDLFVNLVSNTKIFAGEAVFIDGFSFFNEKQLNFIKALIRQCKDVYFTFTVDNLNYKDNDFDCFAYSRKTMSRIIRLTNEAEVSLADPVIITEDTFNYSRTQSVPLIKVEKNFLKTDATVYDAQTDDIEVFTAESVESECQYVARKIRELLQKDYRCRDIAVITRNINAYQFPLKAAFKKYEIPFFEDKREPVSNQPLIIFVKTLLEILSVGLRSELIFKLLKTGLFSFSTEEISDLENYVYIWQIKGKKWFEDWTGSVNGFDEQETDKEKLKYINNLKTKCISPLISLRENFKFKTGFDKAQLIYDFLIDNHINENLKNLAVELNTSGEIELADEQSRIWDILMDILDCLSESCGKDNISNTDFYNYFNLCLETETLGKIPAGIDEIIVGSADRIILNSVKAVFIVGLNYGSFPMLSSKGSILTDRDRNTLLKEGIELFDNAQNRIIYERFIAYSAFSYSKDKLYLSYVSDNTDSPDDKDKSEFLIWVEKIFPNCLHIKESDLSASEYISGKNSSFETLIKHYDENNDLINSLYNYFLKDNDYKAKLKSIGNIKINKPYEINNKSLANKLLTENLHLTASRIDTYNRCPFQYFCKYALKIKPRNKAELNQLLKGTLVHYVFESILKNDDLQIIVTDGAEKLYLVVKNLVYDYVDKNFGGIEDKDNRFRFIIDKIIKLIVELLFRMKAEFDSSVFKPCNFELLIGDSENEPRIKPYIFSSSSGKFYELTGRIDRVDKAVINGINYIKIVDYKTGSKKFEIQNILSGIDLQMLLYLFAIWSNGEELYGQNINPAAVIYFHAKNNMSSDDQNKADGFVLEDADVILGVNNEGNSLLSPAYVKNGKIHGKTISLSNLLVLNKRVNEMIKEMLDLLENGKIPALPIEQKNNYTDKAAVCSYCDYKSVCSHEDWNEFKPLSVIDKLSMLDEYFAEKE